LGKTFAWIIGKFFENVTLENFVWEYWEKSFENVVLEKFIWETWECFTWENFIWENGNILLGKIFCSYLLNKVL
jgi:hypothetical protein